MGQKKRQYLATHPWIRIELDLASVDFEIWHMIGEAQSKAMHLAGTPLLPRVAEQLRGVYLSKGALATVAIEGNTLTEAQARAHLEGKLQLPPSRQYHQDAIENVIGLLNETSDAILRGERLAPLSPRDLCEFNRRILKDLPLGEDVVPGELRAHQVVVGQYPGAPAKDLEYLLEQLCAFCNEKLDGPVHLRMGLQVVRAIAAHVLFVQIHPFGDGNGRVARLLEFRMLLGAGLPDTSAHILANHYNQTRDRYYQELNHAWRSNGDKSPFLRYAMEGFLDGLREQIDFVKTQQLEVHWVNYVHERFREGTSSRARSRRRDLVLALGLQTAPDGVDVAAIPTLTPDLAAQYSGKTSKTVRRDVNEVVEMGLVAIDGARVRARKELMIQFLPRMIHPPSEG